MVSLTKADETTGGLCLIPTSHLYHDELMDSLPQSQSGHYVQIPGDCPALLLPQILPCLDAGDMVLWDSRTMHCSTHALSSPSSPVCIDRLLRMAAYVSMSPRSWATPLVLETRVLAYKLKMTTSHWSHICTYHIPEREREGEVNSIESATPIMRKLIGIAD